MIASDDMDHSRKIPCVVRTGKTSLDLWCSKFPLLDPTRCLGESLGESVGPGILAPNIGQTNTIKHQSPVTMNVNPGLINHVFLIQGWHYYTSVDVVTMSSSPFSGWLTAEILGPNRWFPMNLWSNQLRKPTEINCPTSRYRHQHIGSEWHDMTWPKEVTETDVSLLHVC